MTKNSPKKIFIRLTAEG